MNKKNLVNKTILESKKINKCNILCIGDVMLDHYVYGNVYRSSPEAPIPILSKKDGIDLHILNDAVMKEYNKTINEFLSYLILVGEQLEEYEKCSELILQQKRYKKWLTVNLETVKSISNLLKDLKHKYDD